MQRVIDLLRANIVDVAVKPACSEDAPFACDDFSAGANDYIDVWLCVRVSSLPDAEDTSVAQSNVSFVYAGIIQDQSVCDDRVRSTIGTGGLRLSHTIADHLATAKFNFFTIGG